MLDLRYSRRTYEKRVPLTISRGTETHSCAIWVQLRSAEGEGWGESVPFTIGNATQAVEFIEAGLERAVQILRQYEDLAHKDTILRQLRASAVPTAALAGIDQAMWDLLGRQLCKPVWQLWGGSEEDGPVTSVTVGISSPEVAQNRVNQWLALGDIRAFKFKLGAPEGISADKRMFAAAIDVVPRGARVSVDVNGGWSTEDAITMSKWLAARGVDHIEQPVGCGREMDLEYIRRRSPLPIILDESVCNGKDLQALLPLGGFDGINIKLMKCGGPTDALKLLKMAQCHDLRVLVGCYGNTTLGNAPAASLGSMVDYMDLDSHLNLIGDPFSGLRLHEGRLHLPSEPGFGIKYDEQL